MDHTIYPLITTETCGDPERKKSHTFDWVWTDANTWTKWVRCINCGGVKLVEPQKPQGRG